MDTATGVIVPSAGMGLRMGSGVAKQFLKVAGKPVLQHTLHRLLKIRHICCLVVVTPAHEEKHTRQVLQCVLNEHQGENKVQTFVVAGGAERMDSVENGLREIEHADCGLVLVHDAVRPCFSIPAVYEAVQVAARHGAAVLGVPAVDTVKLVDEHGVVTSTPARERVWLAHTPQIVKKELLLRAYEYARKNGYRGTDEASLIEYAGMAVRMVEGNRENIKITWSGDLDRVEQWLAQEGASSCA